MAMSTPFSGTIAEHASVTEVVALAVNGLAFMLEADQPVEITVSLSLDGGSSYSDPVFERMYPQAAGSYAAVPASGATHAQLVVTNDAAVVANVTLQVTPF